MILGMLKLGCIAIYAAALAGVLGALPAGIGRAAQLVAVGMLVLHALELPFALRRLRRHPSVAAGVLLTLLFGVLHWKALAAPRPA